MDESQWGMHPVLGWMRLILMEAPSSAYHRGMVGLGETT
jgi:hypothetical protein